MTCRCNPIYTRYIPDIYPIYFQHLSASVRPKRPASRSNNLKNVHASQTSSPSVSKYSRTSEESNFSSNIAKVITPVSCSSNLLKSLRIFWMCISLLARMDCTTVAWSFWALSMALWQKTPVTWNLVVEKKKKKTEAVRTRRRLDDGMHFLFFNSSSTFGYSQPCVILGWNDENA